MSGLSSGAGWFVCERGAGDEAVELADHVLFIRPDDVTVVDVGTPIGAARITLAVVDVAGEAAPDGSIEAIEEDGAHSVDGALDAQGRVELELPPVGDGSFRFDGIEPGTYTLTGHPREADPPQLVTIDGPEATLDVTLRLAASPESDD